jgi:hypothetical protein
MRSWPTAGAVARGGVVALLAASGASAFALRTGSSGPARPLAQRGPSMSAAGAACLRGCLPPRALPARRPRHAEPHALSLSDARVLARKAVPKVVAFDLDATLWYPEMYQARSRRRARLPRARARALSRSLPASLARSR